MLCRILQAQQVMRVQPVGSFFFCFGSLPLGGSAAAFGCAGVWHVQLCFFSAFVLCFERAVMPHHAAFREGAVL